MPVGGASLLVYFAERLFQPFELVTAHAKLVLPYNVQLAFGWSITNVAAFSISETAFGRIVVRANSTSMCRSDIALVVLRF
jgi:hypothetical protein